ncbi:MAG: HAD family hydrolase [Candidatus Moraniibacteriota bacterium]
MKMKKKIIFLDGDGTLWYPSSTKRTQKPHWIYHDPETKDDFLRHLELIPNVRGTLLNLKEKGILLVLISASPYPTEAADKELRERLEFFDLLELFHSYRSSQGDNPEGKGELMLEILESLKLAKEDALMVGDSYFYDYLAAKNVGIEALFIENTYARMPDERPEDLQTINEVSDLVNILL